MSGALAACESDPEDPVTTTLELPCGVVAAVTIVIVTATGPFPGVTELGVMLHVEFAGAPLQVRVTGLVKDAPTGVTLKL